MKTIISFLLLSFLFISQNIFAQNSRIWTATSWGGGGSNAGAILQSDSTGKNFHVVYNCNSLVCGNIQTGFTLANTGKLYAVAHRYSSNINSSPLYSCTDSEIVFSLDTSNFTLKEINNLYADNKKEGSSIFSEMINAPNGMLYGLSGAGGLHQKGTIFQLNPFTDSLVAIYHFNDSSGAYPFGKLLIANDGNFYGMTKKGISSNNQVFGVIFKFNPNTKDYKIVHSFNNYNTGMEPGLNSLIQANNNKIYGTSPFGGINGVGILFELDLKNDSFKIVYDFDTLTGSYPNSGLIQATDGKLYGTAEEGGANKLGVLFSFDLINSIFTDLFDFDFSNGANPMKSLIQTSSGKLMGCTTYGSGTPNVNGGVVYSFDINTNSFEKLLDIYDTYTNIGYHLNGSVLETGGRPINPPTIFYNSSNINELKINPNPIEDLIKLDIPSNEVLSIKVFNELGQLVKESQSPSSQLDIKNLQPGYYLVTTKTKEKAYQNKIVKK
jgi:hypothetical protein